MIPRLDISFPIKRQWQFCFGKEYTPKQGEFLLNHARSGIVLALRACFPEGGRVGVVVYNCYTVANAVVSAGCSPFFFDVNEDLTINLSQKQLEACDAVVVTNLFGIRNNIEALREKNPRAVIIVDNAHGYGLPPEGDFTVCSINQGKYPALGEGGLLIVNNTQDVEGVHKQYKQLPEYSTIGSLKLFAVMLMKAVLYCPFIYGILTMKLKSNRTNEANHSPVVLKKMCSGVSRMYHVWVKEHRGQNLAKPFMDIVRTDNPAKVTDEYRAKGIEVDTHFKNCISWAKEFGYIEGSCPNAERLVHHLVMVPNYFKNLD